MLTNTPTKNETYEKKGNIMKQAKLKTVKIETLFNEVISSGSTSQWMKIVETFRNKVISDQIVLGKHEVAGRAILYAQLAEAYKLGLYLVSENDLKALMWLTQHHNISGATDAIRVIQANNTSRRLNAKKPDDEQHEIKKEVNPWGYVVNMLYGKWFDTTGMTDVERQAFAKKIKAKTDMGQYARVLSPPEEAATVYQVWTPNRSAEKYAVVFRYLQNHNVTPEDAAKFIENFDDKTHGKRLLGIERAGRFEARSNSPAKAPSQEVIDKQNAYIARAEARKNWNVFAVEKPSTFPSDVQFARAVIKVEGDELVIVGYQKMEASAYKNHAVKLGKPLLDAENEQAAKRKDEVLEAVNSPEVHSIQNPLILKLAELKADGADGEAIAEKVMAMLVDEEKKLAGSKAIEGFADMEMN